MSECTKRNMNPTNQLIRIMSTVDGVPPELGIRMLLLAAAMIAVAPRGFPGAHPDLFSANQLVKMLGEAHTKAVTLQHVIIGLQEEEDRRVGPTGKTGLP
jgi:hypothetical protein